MCFLAFRFSRKTAIKFQKCCSVSHCVSNSSLTIIWNNPGLSDYKHMKRKFGLKKNTNKNTCYYFKRNYVVPYSKESHLTLMHLWHLSTIPSFWVEYFAERLLKDVSYMFFFLNSGFLLINLIRQTQIIRNDTQWQILETEWHRNISEI